MGKADQEVIAARIAAGEEKERKRKAKERKEIMKKKKNSFFADFKKFITRGNVLDMAVGVIVGGAFTAIINGLSNNILKPIINFLLALIMGKDSLSEIYTFLGDPVYVKDASGVATTEIDLANSIYIDWGAFINAVINFFLIAFTLFVIVRVINKVRAKMDEKETKAAAEKKARQEEEKKRKQEALEAKWAEKDRRDAEKAAEKEAKRLAKERVRKRKALEQEAERARKEADLLNSYIEEYRQKKTQKSRRNN